MTVPHLTLRVLGDTFAIIRLEPRTALPNWAINSRFSSITRTPEELSIVCSQADVPADISDSPGWRCFEVQGPLDFALTGILASLSSALAQAGISIFAVSTYDTDYILVKQERLKDAVNTLTAAGHFVKS